MITRDGKDIGKNIIDNVKNDFLNMLLGNPFPTSNILHQYRTFNYRVTLAIVSAQERKTQSYKTTGFNYIVFQSHGKNAEGFTPGSSATLNKIQSFVNSVVTGGDNKYDFFLEDLFIKSFISGSQDWGTDVRLKIVEPYSMDTFLSSIMTGLSLKGYYTLDRSANFILKIDFVGYRENSEEAEVVPYSTRYYPLAITEINASLTSKGTIYDIKAAAQNDMAKLDDVNIVPEAIKLSGKTVGEVIKSLEDALNGISRSKKEEANIIADAYAIRFVDEQDKEVEASLSSPIITAEIKATRMWDSQEDAGIKEFLKDKSQYKIAKNIEKTSGEDNAEEPLISLTVDGRMGILKIINSIITDSYFIVDRLTVNFEGYYDKEDGQLPWWRVVPVIENGEWIKSQNRYQKIIVYKIIPRKVHYSKLTSTFVPSHTAPASDYDSMIARVYEWNYTGNNKDLLSLDINYNQLWAKVISANFGKKPETSGASKETKTADGIVVKANSQQANMLNAQTADMGFSSTVFDTNPASSKDGQVRSSAETNPMFDLGRDVNAIINNPYEQVSLNMEILGDPMWLGTQFIDDRSVVGQGSKLFTVDGGIAIRTVDPIVRILAYAPKDVNAEGFIAPNTGELRELSRYSAHYTVNEIESFFQNGVFKQRIKGYRDTKQDMAQLAPKNTGDRIGWNQIDLSVR
jgi:hypothetical protein